MKSKILFLILIASIALLSCKKDKDTYKPRIIKNINLQKFDHTKFGLKKLSSIRSIEVVDSTAFFIGEKGKIYGFYPNGNFLITPNNFFNGKEPDFRSSSHAKYNLFALSIGKPALLYKITMDNKSGLKDPTLVYTENEEKTFYDAMAFFDDNNGIAIGDPTGNCLSILRTKDGGNTWKKINCSNLPGIKDGEAAFAASNTNIAVIGNNAWVITGGKSSRIFHTKNKGESWFVYNTPIIQGKETTGGYSVAFNDANNGIICGGDFTDKKGNKANKAITKNGGKTWQLIADGKEPGYISCVQYVPNTNGKELFAVSTEGIYYSNNSGISWVQVNKEGYYTIRFVDKNNAWLAGNNKIARLQLN